MTDKEWFIGRLYMASLGWDTVLYWRNRAKWAGVYKCALMMRRKGIGLQTALAILAHS